MNDIPEIKALTISIDRLQISISDFYRNKIEGAVAPQYKRYFEPDLDIEPERDDTKWIRHKYINKKTGCRIHIKKAKIKPLYNPRAYVELFQPSTEDQEFIKTVLEIIPITYEARLNPCIKVIEIAYDMEPQAPYTKEGLRDYWNHHLHRKHSRMPSVTKIGDTVYFGLNGNVRTGQMGFRSYLSIKAPRCYRLEMQLNRDFLRRYMNDRVQIRNMPFHPGEFTMYFVEYANVLDDFSSAQMKNTAQTILRNDGITLEAETEERQDIVQAKRFFNFRRNMLDHQMSLRVYGSTYHTGTDGQNKRSVSEQIDSVKQIKQKYGLAMSPLKFCEDLGLPDDFVSMLINA